MPWLAALLVGAVSNLDNLGVGVAFGARGTRIGTAANVIIAGITMAATAAAVTCGHILSKLFPSGVTAWLGPGIIIAIGIATVLSSERTSGARGASGVWRDPGVVDGTISWREAVVVGFALSVNNLGTGVGAGVAGIPAVATMVGAGLLSLAAVGGGSHFGRALGRLALGRHAPLVAGMLLLAVGAAMLPGVR